MSPPSPRPSRLALFLAELKRRHVVRFSVGYAAVAFVVLQLAEIVFPAFGIGETGLRILVVAVALLFPPAVVLAWIFDVTGEGLERTADAPGPRSRLVPGLALLVLSVAIVGGVWLWLAQEGVLEQQASPRGRRAGTAEPALVAYDPAEPVRALAVLPLDDFSGGEDGAYFTLGMQEELIAQLSQIPGLRVVSRTSVQRYAGADVPISRIGRELQVDAVIEGSVRRSGDEVRITVQLIHAASDTHIWTQQYDRALQNVLALQSEVALDIARQIQAEISPEEASVLQQVATRAVDPEAQDAYLRGRYEASKGTPEALVQARSLFEAAVEEDSSFAPALASLAGTRFLIGLADSMVAEEELTRAQAEAAKALELDSASVEAREVLSLIRRNLPVQVFSGDVARELARGLPRPGPGAGAPATPETGAPPVPDTAWFQALSALGRQIEFQVRSQGRAAANDAGTARFVGARGLMAAGMFDDAVEMLSDVVDAQPNLAPAWELMARAEMARGNLGGAVGAVEAWSARGGPDAPDAVAVKALRSNVEQEGGVGFWRWTLNRLDARSAAGGRVAPSDLAAARAGIGDAEGALRALEEALAQRDRGLVSLQKDPVWDDLRNDPRFTEVARRSRGIHADPRGRDGPLR